MGAADHSWPSERNTKTDYNETGLNWKAGQKRLQTAGMQYNQPADYQAMNFSLPTRLWWHCNSLIELLLVPKVLHFDISNTTTPRFLNWGPQAPVGGHRGVVWEPRAEVFTKELCSDTAKSIFSCIVEGWRGHKPWKVNNHWARRLNCLVLGK